jgi:hypothetical protein
MVFNTSLQRRIGLGLVAGFPQKAVQGLECNVIVTDEKNRETPGASRPHQKFLDHQWLRKPFLRGVRVLTFVQVGSTALR